MLGQPNHILLIEDDRSIANSLQAGLEREGYSVSWKDHGMDGLTYAQEKQPHLILLDIRLPDMSGFDVCRQLRQLKLHQPLIMLTARAEESDKILGLEMGADDYVTKPVSLGELLSRIRAQLRRAYGEFSSTSDTENEKLYARDISICRQQGQAMRNNRVLNLTPTEFRLLVYMTQHKGQALTRAQILDSVWGYSSDVESEQTVNVHIRRLREKVELDPSHPSLILTVPGIGYRLVE